MVTISGVRMLHSEILTSTYTNKNGEYNMILDVPNKYVAINSGVPNFPIENPKFVWLYRLSKIFINNQQTKNCCDVPIGKKTQWDFELASK